ncbi:MAG: NADPH-dependent 7-cyano-7-deazaguanine reductase QueF [Kangiella sp.]|nr:MAG: NADPH-dependent 7-cyano-7-deazaguanine reductase QueF [Kangiella sp.]
MSKKNTNDAFRNPLGQVVKYDCEYNPKLLFPINRQEKRNELFIGDILPFTGEDIWNAYEISWLNDAGLPQVALAEFRFRADSECIIESKSFKLYLNSFNQSYFKCSNDLTKVMQNDLREITNSKVVVKIMGLDNNYELHVLKAKNIDDQCITIDTYNYSPELLSLVDVKNESIVEESLISHLLKSNCLITNQPDWASILVEYKGLKICEQSLLKYIVSFRSHNEFHEQCVERIFVDIMKYCKPEKLTVYARYTRRGGLDINPWRSNHLSTMDNVRLSRQ